ncbi:MAG: signal peptidase I, partial [Lactobacillaceae bacterium]|nr:signal peptidase I [Lactobacillaceae bacterium]
MNNKKIVLSAIIGLLIAVFIKQNILSLQVVRSNAMSPNIVNGNWLILNKIKNVSRGTIIIYKMPSYNGKDYLIGRVIGVSGDMVKYQNGYLTVNNKKVSDWYLNYQENIATSLNDSDWSIQSLSRNLSWPIKFQNTS